MLSNRTTSRAKGKRKTTRKTATRKRSSPARKRGGAARSRTARRQWDRSRKGRKGTQGRKGRRVSPLSSFLPILERREDKKHVVSFDPQEAEADGAPTRRSTRRSSRGRTSPRARGRRTVREAEGDLEEVQTPSRRRSMRGAPMQEEGDKIQIEVGAVKALSTKYGIVRGMTWMVLLSMLLWWVPVLGPATVGYVGGRKSGGPFRAAVAALLPLLFVFGFVAFTTSSAENVPLAIQHYISEGYQAVLGALPFDFPLLSYVFSNLAALMASGPDVLFTVLAFALVGGAVTQMRIHERSVPPITARLPKHRMVQGPARSYENVNEALEMLVARLAAVVERAERRGRGLDTMAAGDGPPHRGRGWSGPLGRLGKHSVPEEYPSLQSQPSGRSPGATAGAGALDPSSRQVVSAMLASTAPQAKGRVAKQAVRAARPVSLDIPQGIAFTDEPGSGSTAAPLGAAHVYRPSKLYHIYGGTVNPVARKKLEKRLRRTHTLHTMRQGARALVKQPDALPRSERHRLAEVDELVDDEPGKPRSLESSAIASSLEYDALEHLENATVAPKRAAAPQGPKRKQPKPDTRLDGDELGGLIAHLGEGGEAVVDQDAVQEIDFSDGPVFDRRGRQRARIAPEDQPARRPEKPASAPSEGDGGQAGPPETPAQARKRREDQARQKARVDRWLEHTLSDIPAGGDKKKTNPKVPAEPEDVKPTTPAAAPKKPKAEPRQVKATPSRFEVTHGSVEADAEADSDDGDQSVSLATGKRKRTAAEILKEIRREKKDEAARKEQADAARRARDAKATADEIERRIRDNADGAVPDRTDASDAEEGGGGERQAVVTAGGQAVALQAAPKPRRHRSDDLEAVLTTAEELSGELELTLDPVREEAPTEREAHAAIADLPMLDPEDPAAEGGKAPGAGREEGGPADEAAAPTPSAEAAADTETPAALPSAPAPPAPPAAPAEGAAADGEPEPERDVSPDEVVMAGPSTDTPGFDPEEAELNDHDREKIKKRLQEGWNRL